MVGFVYYCGMKFLRFSLWKIKNIQTTRLGKETIEKRNSKFFKFDTSHLNVKMILTLDLAGLRTELLKGTFTSVDLVHVYGERCQTISR